MLLSFGLAFPPACFGQARELSGTMAAPRRAAMFLVCAFGLIVAPMPGMAGSEPLGTAVSVDPIVAAHLPSGNSHLAAGDNLFEGETLVTSAHGKAQIVFTDDTHMVVGPRSTLVIRKYLMRNDNTVDRFIVSALAGTYRFLTGKSDKQAYRIDTPPGTITIRGTSFDFWVARDSGNVGLLLYSGSAVMCRNDGGCITLDQRCSLGLMGQQTGVERVSDASRRDQVISQRLPFVRTQRSLQRVFRVSGAASCGQ